MHNISIAVVFCKRPTIYTDFTTSSQDYLILVEVINLRAGTGTETRREYAEIRTLSETAHASAAATKLFLL